MASYLSSYFSSTTSPPQTYPNTASSTSSWSSRIATLRKALTKDSEEDDPDFEDCSHVSNVLRAYYTEKGRALPEWLPPDPKKPVMSPPPPQGNYGQYGNTYGANAGYGAQPVHGRGGSGGRGGLSDLWDSAPAQAPPSAVPQSLRAARPTAQSFRSQDSGMNQVSASASHLQPTSAARPLPSQRAGSYQTSNANTNPSASASALGSRDRLRAKLQGGGGSGRNSPSNNSINSSTGSLTYPSNSGNYQGSTGSGPFVGSSEPWSNNDEFGFANYSMSQSSGQYRNQDYRQRPGGPR